MRGTGVPETAIGIDLSLTCTGITLALDGRAIVHSVRSAPPPGLKKGEQPSLRQRYARLHTLRSEILRYVGLPDLVAIEQPAYSKSQGSSHDRSGLWWMIVAALHARDIPVAEVTPTTLKKYVLGSGKGDKDAVVIAATRKYPAVEFDNNNEADALVLAAMALRQLGAPLEVSCSKAMAEAMSVVRWPTI